MGCVDEFLWFDAAVEMRFYRPNTGDDFIQLSVVGRDRNSNAEWVVPEFGSDGTITFPGTRLYDSSQVTSNFVGEGCVFPVARLVVDMVCEQIVNENNQDNEEKPPDSGFRTENNRLTLVGHSLGGAVTQFIATSWSSQRNDTRSSNCPGYDAYAFGSIGLEPPDSDYQQAVHGSLVSYISNCDWVAQKMPFSKRIQLGHLFTLSHTDKHLIDSIQKSVFMSDPRRLLV